MGRRQTAATDHEGGERQWVESIGGVRRRDSAEGETERLKTKACHRWSLRVGVIVGKAEAKGEVEVAKLRGDAVVWRAVQRRVAKPWFG